MTKRNPNFDYPTSLDMNGLDLNIEILESHLETSYIEPFMTDVDVKKSLQTLNHALRKQMLINQTLIRRIRKLEKRRFLFWRK